MSRKNRMKAYDVAIIGGGVLGLSVAYLLSKQTDLAIAIYNDRLAAGSASEAAGAMLNVFSEVDENSFLCPERFEMARSATAYWPDWIDQLRTDSKEKIDLRYGTNFVCLNEDDKFRFGLVEAALKKYNEPYNKLNSEQLIIPGEGWVNPHQILGALTESIKGKVDFIWDRVVKVSDHNIISETGVAYADKIVIANGAFARNLLTDFRVPRLFFGVGTGLLLTDLTFPLTEVIRTPVRIGSCGIFLVPRPPTDLYLGASSWVVDKPEYSPRFSSVNTLTTEVQKIIPEIRNSKIKAIMTGFRPVTEDCMPLIGELSVGDVFVLTGTRRDGFHCSPLLAQDMVNRLTGKEPLVPDIFKPERDPMRLLSKEEGILQAERALKDSFLVGEKYENLDYGVFPEVLNVV